MNIRDDGGRTNGVNRFTFQLILRPDCDIEFSFIYSLDVDISERPTLSTSAERSSTDKKHQYKTGRLFDYLSVKYRIRYI